MRYRVNDAVACPQRRTLARIAAEAGYTTSAITSWKGFVRQQVYGFDTWYSQDGAGALSNRGEQTLGRVLQWIEGVDADRPQFLSAT